MRYEYNLQGPKFTAEHIDILNISRKKNYIHSYRNGRTKHGFIFIVRGMMCDTFYQDEGEMPIELNEGELIFIPKDSAYVGAYLGRETEIKIVQFDIASGTLPDYLSKPVKIDLPNVSELIEAFFKTKGSNPADHPFYYFSCLYYLLWQIDTRYFRLPTKFKKLQPALSELSHRYEQNVPIAYYAELSDMSEVNFRRLFREYTGMTPIEYRNDLRLGHARTKLQSGEYNVSEAAESSGFSNLSFFIRLYKKKYGYTPKKE